MLEEAIDEEYVKDLRQRVIDELQSKFGYCGVADGEKLIHINSGEGNIQIKITWE